jgi:hypothetical protein
LFCLTKKQNETLIKSQHQNVGFFYAKTHYFYRMKRMSFRCLTLVSVYIVLLLSCNKTRYTPAAAVALFQSDVHAQAEDQIRIPNEIDALFNDINTILLYHDTVINDTETITSHFPTLCGLYAVTQDNVDSTGDVITVQYDAKTCDGTRSRLGTIYLYQKPGSSFTSAGDTVGVYFDNFKTYWLADDDSVVLNAPTFYLVNSSGGSLANFNAASQPIVQEIIGVNATVQFETLVTATWQVWRRRAYTYNGGTVITTTGIDTTTGLQGVSEVGGNRYGNGFITTITNPLVVDSACSMRITAGKEQVVNPAGTTILTFGLDSSGHPTSCPLKGTPYYCQATWSGTGEAPDTAQIPYYSYY